MANIEFRQMLESYFNRSIGSSVEKLENFTKYVPQQRLVRFLVRYEIVKKLLPVHGSIVECGVLFGFGLTTWAQLSSLLEPFNHQRRIIGFDTFSGFPSISQQDKSGKSIHLNDGGLSSGAYEDLNEAIRLFDLNRLLNHIPKVEVIKGDASMTIPQYVRQNQHLVVSLLNLDFDIYEPTKIALEHLVPRMPKGGIIVFDELNNDLWPGETVAVMETIGIRNLKLERSVMGTTISYAVLD